LTHPSHRLLSDLCAAAPRLRVMLVSAHPDDEVIGAGSLIARLSHVSIVQVTDGAPMNPADARALGFDTREEYAAARRRERDAALALANVPPSRVRELGVVDQSAVHHVVDIARELASEIHAQRPDVVITHPYEGGHPDHDATALAVFAAVDSLASNGPPLIVEMTSYHSRAGELSTGQFLFGDVTLEQSVVLSAAERERKLAMFRCYTTQQHLLAPFTLDVERFRCAPTYDFSRPPHEGPLWYEHLNRGVTPSEWRMLAARALSQVKSGRATVL
jgi:N-acetylglucosamine malate deacetylase 2